jgi:hypothetical protein
MDVLCVDGLEIQVPQPAITHTVTVQQLERC